MKLKGELPISRDTIQQILDSPIPYEDEKTEDEEEIKGMLASLTPEQAEIAAQTSYAYWLASLSDKPPTDAERERMALREMRRTLFKTTPKKAITFAQDTIKLRIEKRIDIVRSCFMENVEYDSDEDQKLAEKLRGMIEDDMAKQISVVHGHDKDDLAILTVFSRTSLGASDEAFLYMILYAMERATAATEFLSLAANEKIMVVLDFGSFDSSVAPSWNGAKEVAVTLQHHYPQRLKRLVMLDPPFWIKTMYSLVSPFLDPLTKKKFVVCSGEGEKQKLMEEYVDPAQAMPFMLRNGKLTGDIDAHHYVKGVPFHVGYGDPQKEALKTRA